MIFHLRLLELQLERSGWRGPEAEWIALVCWHSGLFTRALRFVRRLLERRPAVEEPLGGLPTTTRPCSIVSRARYRALGLGARSSLAGPAARRQAGPRPGPDARRGPPPPGPKGVLRHWRRARPQTGHQWLTSQEHQEVESIRQAVIEGDVGTLAGRGGAKL